MRLRTEHENSKAPECSVAPGDRALHNTYRCLSLCLDVVESQLTYLDDLLERACMVILEDDLMCLVEECEEILVGEEFTAEQLASFECRSETIIEEVVEMMRGKIFDGVDLRSIERMILAHDLED